MTETSHSVTTQRPVVTVECSGKWVAWSEDGMQIVGTGETPEEAEASARESGIDDIIFEWVPPADTPFVERCG